MLVFIRFAAEHRHARQRADELKMDEEWKMQHCKLCPHCGKVIAEGLSVFVVPSIAELVGPRVCEVRRVWLPWLKACNPGSAAGGKQARWLQSNGLWN